MSEDAVAAAPPSSVAKKYWIFAAVFLISLALDQGTKIWARASLAGHPPTVVVAGYFDLRYSENPGSAFGLFRGVPGARWLLLGIGVGAMAVVGTMLRRLKAEQLRVAAELGLLAGGALGNIIDRVARGVVTDFVVWKVGQHEWPTFNVADAALVVGVLALLIDMRDEKRAPAADGATKKKRRR